MKEFKTDKDFINLQSRILKTITEEICSRTETLLEIGLSKKGYAFTDKEEMYEFIKENCSKEYVGDEEKYFVSREPFLLVNNTPYFNFNNYDCSVTYGDFKFL